MRAPLFAALLAFAGLCAVPPANAADPVQVESLMALARTYGVVRYFHPSDSLDKVNWDRFLVHAAERMGTIGDNTQIGPRLEELFTPIVEGFRVTTPGAPTSAPQGEGPQGEGSRPQMVDGEIRWPGPLQGRGDHRRSPNRRDPGLRPWP